ncbi:hypothetical protein B0T26DRAFT_752463 [Lasiosphaeria miniovina]|uniref:Uncharacterized protein n=1 Tax=Lasiosphaeria miniovina TaxID=1954250 RepID=A0AA40AMF9_9PEZI|nr:uncharacterized protein B0T26DRAFT_752463 [Lasiosphaeria miniovina]KAK0718555.1 hypothetical protein B0T26DRAFT_752463 [Lasiosphaeria miniovina]
MRNIAWLKDTVPSDRLVFVDGEDGWGPLCRALGKDVPRGVPFPRINDGEAIERLSKEMALQGLVRWAWILAALAAVVARRFVVISAWL